MLADITKELTALKLGAMATRLRDWVADPVNQSRSHLECVSALMLAQSQSRVNKRARAFLCKSDLPLAASTAGFRGSGKRGLPAQTLANLSTCEWVGSGHAVVITGPSYSGKTYLAAALAREAVLGGLSTVYWRLPQLLTACTIEKQKSESALAHFLRATHKPKLLVLDDFAIERLTREQCYLARQILDARARHNRALMVVSATALDGWARYFSDAGSADAIFARVMCRHHHIELKALRANA